MPMAQEDLERRLRAAFPQAEIVVTDLAGDGDHYRARIIDMAFKGLPRVRQHQLVYANCTPSRWRPPRRRGAEPCAIAPSVSTARPCRC
jgi:acid stress-induced BolA-like protein IbaG/YrbA